VENRLSLHAGFWYDALPPGEPQRFHVIIATPPQTPGHCAFGPSYGGYDGTMHLFAIIDSAPRYLEPRRGRLWILAISLANPSALMHRLGSRFFDVRLIHTSERYFCASEYESMEKGLVDHFLALRSLGCAEFNDTGNDRYVFYNLFIRASGAKRA
jgi:hypothetical protein